MRAADDDGPQTGAASGLGIHLGPVSDVEGAVRLDVHSGECDLKTRGVGFVGLDLEVLGTRHDLKELSHAERSQLVFGVVIGIDAQADSAMARELEQVGQSGAGAFFQQRQRRIEEPLLNMGPDALLGHSGPLHGELELALRDGAGRVRVAEYLQRSSIVQEDPHHLDAAARLEEGGGGHAEREVRIEAALGIHGAVDVEQNRLQLSGPEERQ